MSGGVDLWRGGGGEEWGRSEKSEGERVVMSDLFANFTFCFLRLRASWLPRDRFCVLLIA